ncbi:MAG: potassium transporter Kup [Deltaproteobacteria bacterium]|nr:potassium transporter Kup [Deltaproteobacteria bacterium]
MNVPLAPAADAATLSSAPAPARRPTPVPGHATNGAGEATDGHGHGHGDVNGRKLIALALGAVGVVFGDIGTSPLYTIKECAHALHHGDGVLTSTDVLQILSLIFWSMTMVVTVKYVTFIMRADNRGEGGIMALGALLPERWRANPRRPLTALSVLVVVGSAALYGDGAITPAISVLSAMEGLTLAQPHIPQWLIVGLTVVILMGLFGIQSRGTALLGTLFGPVMFLWFLVLAGTGAWYVVDNPAVLAALNPAHAVAYFADHGVGGIVILGSVVLAVTGGEALYADMGHFGLKPIRLAWLTFVMPALLLNYMGQGALLMKHPEAITNPFFAMVPTGNWTYALVVLSSLATIVASQALISGSFSLTKQAMQMGLFPRVTVKHTAEEEKGQIYIPEVNGLLAAACIALVFTFRSSSALAGAYGLGVTTTMLTTSTVFLAVLVGVRGWRLSRALPLFLLFVGFDLPFLAANLLKIPAGGYVPLLLGSLIVVAMLVWHQGRWQLFRHYTDRFVSFDEAWPELEREIAQRTPGTGIFMAASDDGLPPILSHLVQRTHALHKQILLVTVVTTEQPKVEKRDRLKIETLGHGFHRVHVYFGFMEQPNVPRALNLAIVRRDLDFDLDEATYYLARERVLAGPGGGMGVLPEKIFGFLNRNATNADRYFQIPNAQVIEVGTLVDL